MATDSEITEHSRWLKRGACWLGFVGLLGVLTGSGCALFLWSLDLVTQRRVLDPQLLWGLPAAGVLIGWLSQRVSHEINAGTQHVIHEIKHPRHGVSIGMAPFVLFGTLLTHLCGGSAGREGTAVQIGTSLAGGLSRFFPECSEREKRWLLMCGVAAGFGGVFGTPWAGMVFALEIAALGRWEWRAIAVCLLAAFWSDWVCSAWGTEHTKYTVQSLIVGDGVLAPLRGKMILVCVIGGVLFGGIARLFATVTEGVQALSSRWIRISWLRTVCGGCLIVGLTLGLGTRDYLGIGVNSPEPGGASLLNAFQPVGVPAWSWGWKLLFTAITLGSGFKGGEATPLFFIGATAGHQFGTITGVPVDWLAAIGFVAVFSSATHTPLAGTVMACELFGIESVLYYGIGCFVANTVSGQGVYTAQSSDVEPLPSHLCSNSQISDSPSQ